LNLIQSWNLSGGTKNTEKECVDNKPIRRKRICGGGEGEKEVTTIIGGDSREVQKRRGGLFSTSLIIP